MLGIYTIYHVSDASQYLNVKKYRLYQLLQTGQIEAFKLGGKWKIPRKSLNKYIRQCNKGKK